MKLLMLMPALALAVAACATTPKAFYENPAKAKDTALCRLFFETSDPAVQADVGFELGRRGLTNEQCQQKITAENIAIGAIALVATGVAVAGACSGGGCGAPSYAPAMDRDCRGGSGDGPIYVNGPIWVGNYDPDRLDGDNNGWGCEARDMAYYGS